MMHHVVTPHISRSLSLLFFFFFFFFFLSVCLCVVVIEKKKKKKDLSLACVISLFFSLFFFQSDRQTSAFLFINCFFHHHASLRFLVRQRVLRFLLFLSVRGRDIYKKKSHIKTVSSSSSSSSSSSTRCC